jgi:hypothetical protein
LIGRALDGSADLPGYRWRSAAPTCAHAYPWPAVQRIPALAKSLIAVAAKA